ncbi:MAG: DNA-binding protein [Thermoprotei archaeon]
MSENQHERRIVVLDTSAIISGYINPSYENYTVNGVLYELDRFKVEFESSPLSLFVNVVDPSEEYIVSARLSASKTGDSVLLSKTDLSLIGLALQLQKTDGRRVELATDDYALTNVVKFLVLNHSFIGVRKPVFKLIRWKWFCPACHRVYSNGEMVCPDCGEKLKRKPR